MTKLLLAGLVAASTAACTANPADRACGVLDGSRSLAPGDSVASCNGLYVLRLQPDGNLVLSKGPAVLWATGTDGATGAHAWLVDDGNFVLDTAAVGERTANPLWATRTSGHPDAVLEVTNVGTVQVVDGSPEALWVSQTGDTHAAADL